jgi:NAD(P)-dependent dehydrogenase (short-subunit alcohol dehydrogenase family)
VDLELTGRVAIVTGASRGVGKAIARELALEGVDVAICSRNRESLDATAKAREKSAWSSRSSRPRKPRPSPAWPSAPAAVQSP